MPAGTESEIGCPQHNLLRSGQNGIPAGRQRRRRGRGGASRKSQSKDQIRRSHHSMLQAAASSIDAKKPNPDRPMDHLLEGSVDTCLPATSRLV
jgi:hypothetical protein